MINPPKTRPVGVPRKIKTMVTANIKDGTALTTSVRRKTIISRILFPLPAAIPTTTPISARQRDGDQGEEHRGTRPVDHMAENIPAEKIGAQKVIREPRFGRSVVPGRGIICYPNGHFPWIVGRDERREHRDQGHQTNGGQDPTIPEAAVIFSWAARRWQRGCGHLKAPSVRAGRSTCKSFQGIGLRM